MSLIHKLQNGCSVSKHESNINPIRALGDKVPCQWAVIFDRILSFLRVQFSSVQSLVMSDSLRPHELQHARPPWVQLPESTQTQFHWVGDAIQPSHPLSSPSPPALNPSQHQSFPMSQLFAWSGRSTGVSALASLLDLLGVQGTLKSLLQHHSSKLSAINSRRSAFFTVQLFWELGLNNWLKMFSEPHLKQMCSY